MKKLFIIPIMVLTMAIISFGQNVSNHINIKQQIIGKDTISTFILVKMTPDFYRKKLIAKWGTPAENRPNLLKWNNISLDSIGKEMQISLIDRVFTKGNSMEVSNNFTEQQKKNQEPRNQKTIQWREVELKFEDKTGKNAINDKKKIKQIAELLESSFK